MNVISQNQINNIEKKLEEISKKLESIIRLLKKREIYQNYQESEMVESINNIESEALEEHTAYEMYQRKKRWIKDSFLSSGGYGDDYPYNTAISKPKVTIPHVKEGESIINFRGAKISKTEADVLNKLENAYGREFFFNNTECFISQMSFRVVRNRVIELGLYGIGILELPDYIENLEALQILVLSRNSLIDLPESIGNLNYLEELYLDQNELITLPESIGNLRNLNYLNLDMNSLNSLPESFGQLISLAILRCNKNKLVSLPESIGTLKNLKELDVNKNHLKGLPNSLFKLSQLEVLNLGSNRIESLPDEIGNLLALESLDLVDNRLKTLPLTIQKLKSLQYLWIKKNPIDMSEDSDVSKLSQFLRKKGTRL